MRHNEGIFTGIRDHQFFYQYWLPEGDPKAVLLLVHGLAEHSGRYTNLVNHLILAGYAVYSLDHLGHGKSEGTRVYVDRFEDFTVTIKTYYDMVREWQPELPIFLVGHSMGGLIAAEYLLENQDDFRGAIISGPMIIIPDHLTKAEVTLSKMFSVVLPKVGMVGIDPAGISRDPGVIEAYINDPLVYRGKTTARLGSELLVAMNRVTERAGEITLPILIIQGSEDKLVNPTDAQLLHDTVSSEDKTLKMYEGFYHEVYNEPDYARVLNDVLVWLGARL